MAYKDCFHRDDLITMSQVWINKTSLSPPLFIEVSVPSHESERSCTCVLRVSILSLSTDI